MYAFRHTSRHVLVAVSAEETLYVTGDVSSTVNRLGTRCDKKRTVAVTFHQDVIVLVQDFVPQNSWAKDLVFARDDRRPSEGISLRFRCKPERHPAIRSELTELGLEPMLVEAGLEYALAYPDEMLLWEDCTHGWLIEREIAVGLLGYEITNGIMYRAEAA